MRMMCLFIQFGVLGVVSWQKNVILPQMSIQKIRRGHDMTKIILGLHVGYSKTYNSKPRSIKIEHGPKAQRHRPMTSTLSI